MVVNSCTLKVHNVATFLIPSDHLLYTVSYNKEISNPRDVMICYQTDVIYLTFSDSNVFFFTPSKLVSPYTGLVK